MFHLDQLLSFIGDLTLEQVHDVTLKAFIDHVVARGLAPKQINNAIIVDTAIMNRSASVLRGSEGRSWLRHAPSKLTRLYTKGKQAKPYPLSWDEQSRLLKALPEHLDNAALFALNTGYRELDVCNLSWKWQINVKEYGVSVFVLPETMTKT